MDTSATTMASELDTPSEIQAVEPKTELMESSLTQAEDPLQLASSTSLGNEETNSGEWTSDDIPEFLNIIRKEVDAEKKSPDTVGGDGQMETEQKEETGQKVKTEQKEETEQKVETEAEAQPPPLDPWAKLMSVRTKNPVSGLTEYARYLRHPCEFLHLNCSGPSHRPRFRIQVKLNGRLFPVADGSSKKIAKKDAAAIALRRIITESAKKLEKELPEDWNAQLQPTSDFQDEPSKAPAPKKRRLAPNKPAPWMGHGRAPPYGSDYHYGDGYGYGEPGYGEPGYGGPPNYPVCDMNQTVYPDDVNQYPGRNGNEGVGPQKVRPHARFSNDYQRNHVENYPMEDPLESQGSVGGSADRRSPSERLLAYLDTFQIENENDAQQVLKVTQKLTDMLVEYRLRSGSAVSGLNTTPTSTSYQPSFPPSRVSSNSDRFSGQSSFSSAPQRFH